MTENQLYPMSSDIFDTSSNSSNPLKSEFFSLGLSNSNSSSALFGTSGSSIYTISPPPPTLLITEASSQQQHLSSAFSNTSSTNHSNCNSGNTSSLSNVMLTNAISIPRSNNSNQSHHSIFQDDFTLQNHPHNPSRLLQQMLSSSSTSTSTSTSSPTTTNATTTPQNDNINSQQNSNQILDDFSDYGLDALDASSLSSTLLQDVSLTVGSPLDTSLQNVITTNGNFSVTGFYAQDTLDYGVNSVMNNVNCETGSLLDNLGDNRSTTIDDDANNSLIYEAQAGLNSGTIWSDIGCAIITTKTEPFNLDDDYLFRLDKSTLQSSGFINDESLLEAFDNIGQYLPDNGQDNSIILSQEHMKPEEGQVPLDILQQQTHLTQLQTLQSNAHNRQNPQQQQQQILQNASVNAQLSSSKPYDIYHSTPNKFQQQLGNNVINSTFSPGSQPSHSPLQINSVTPPPQILRSQQQYGLVKSQNMQQLIKKELSMSPENSGAFFGHSVPGSHTLISSNALSPSSGSSGFGSTTGGSTSTVRKSLSYQHDSNSRLSSSAPTHLSLDHIWIRREPRQHLQSTGSLAEAESISSLSTASVLSPEAIDLSQDDEDDDASTDYNSDQYDDFSSNNGSDNEDDDIQTSSSLLCSSKGKERFFWQYNVQAKGPKGKRLVFQTKLEDPHKLNEITDPVFSPNCSVRGIKVYKHSGKARKGDGNDLTPNPRKLHCIGKELDKLSRTINDMTPVSELPFNVRSKSRKEKNKLASRACRLKKKAQHEANKIKLFGLEIEHRTLLNGIVGMKQALFQKYHNNNIGERNDKVDQEIELIYQVAASGLRIAGGTPDFVNKVLTNVKSGIPSGGLEELRNN